MRGREEGRRSGKERREPTSVSCSAVSGRFGIKFREVLRDTAPWTEFFRSG
jgi:hypothetical protein